MTSGCTVCVSGFPTELPPQRVVDKLTVHFQRVRNGGGEIANVRFAPESPDRALITFEEAAVAQRVLKTDKQLLAVAGKSYPLRVRPYAPGLNPNEIFVRVHMEIDYGRIPGGKEILQNLCKQYAGIVFKFPTQKTSCVAKGPFTELRAFSAELLRCFRSKQRDSTAAQDSAPDQNSSPDKRRSAEQAGGAPKAQAGKKSQEAASEGPPPIKPKEKCTEPPEDFSLVMDSDVYFYMRTFFQEELSGILLEHHVGLVDASGEGIATLYLQTAARGAEGARALASARLAISRLSQQLEATLRKEKISQRDLGGVEGASRLLGELQGLCPQLLCRQDEEHFSLIGNMVEVSQAKQYIQGFTAAREAARGCQKPDVPRAVSMPQMHVESPMPLRHAPSAGSLPRRGSLPRWPSGKTGCKLATRFNASDSSASLPSSSSQDTPLAGLLPGDFSPAADYRPAETRNLSLQGAPAPAPGRQVKQSLESKAGSPVTLSGGPLPSLEAWRRSKTLLPFCAPSSTLRSFDLLDAPGNEDPKISDLRRPNASVSPKPQNGRDSVDEPSPVARVNVDRLQPSSREKSIRLSQQEVRQEGRGRKAVLQSPPVQTVQREGGSQEGLLTGPPGHICECFSYSKLGVEGPEDETLAHLCSSLKACHDSVAVSQERHYLGLSYPREAKQQVLKALHGFCAQRLAVLAEQLLSQDAQRQHRKIQEDTSKTEIQRRKGSTTSLLERPPHPPGSLAGENLSFGAQRFPDASQPTVEENFPSDGKVRPSRKLAHAPAAGEEGCPD